MSGDLGAEGLIVHHSGQVKVHPFVELIFHVSAAATRSLSSKQSQNVE